MTKLITGGTGFVGSELAKMLVSRGEEVVLFDIAPRYESIQSIKEKVKVVRGDLANWSEVLNAVRNNKIKSIFHLGAMLSLPSDSNPWGAYRVNANGMMHVLEAARLFNVDKVIFPGTIAIYASQADVPIEIDESTIQKAENMYGLTKLFGELLGKFYAKKFGLDFRAVRFPTVVGPGAKTKHMAQYMAWMIDHALADKPFEIWVEEDTRIPSFYYKDAANALLMLHDAPAENIKTRVYNLAGISLTAKEFADNVKKHIPSAKLSFKPDPEVMKMVGKGYGNIDESYAKNEWGWKIKYNMESMIKDFEKEYKEK